MMITIIIEILKILIDPHRLLGNFPPSSHNVQNPGLLFAFLLIIFEILDYLSPFFSYSGPPLSPLQLPVALFTFTKINIFVHRRLCINIFICWSHIQMLIHIHQVGSLIQKLSNQQSLQIHWAQALKSQEKSLTPKNRGP